ncbi:MULTISPECIES: hypothetical protein [unclassified Kitasatospora]|uniref:hypothetical protein n=1 Tax=unclassified Kitasatospora TaxID=2633591 RepID=UPI002475242A|nr:hypothetical protein [Kitasatospora sp. MAP12-44]
MTGVLTLGDGHQGQWYELDCGGTLPQGNFGSTPLTGGPLWSDNDSTISSTPGKRR